MFQFSNVYYNINIEPILNLHKSQYTKLLLIYNKVKGLINLEIEKIKKNLCYTELVYGRIRKKLKIKLSDTDIEKMIFEIVSNKNSSLEKREKNFYVTNKILGVEVTINSNNYRVITASKVIKPIGS